MAGEVVQNRFDDGVFLHFNGDIHTTLKYYVAQDADEVADELWKAFSEEKEAQAPEDRDLPPKG